MDLNLLATLKDKLLHAKKFTEVWSYFFDHFGEDQEFIEQGERTDAPFLEFLLTQVGESIFGKGVKLTDALLTRLPQHQFIHGRCFLNRALATVIYFEDVHVGLLAVVTSAGGETKMARFTGRPLPGAPAPSPN